jgi:hypothetical protein
MTQGFRQELAEKFKDDTSDELLDKLQSGNLIELAQAVAIEELKSRGIEYMAPPMSQADDFQSPPIPLDEFETIATFSDTTDAHILQGQLEAAGIPVFMPDSHLGVANSFLLSTFSNIRVQVPKSFGSQAAEIIRETQEGKYAIDQPEQTDSKIVQSSLGYEEALLAFSQDPIWIKVWRGRIDKTSIWASFNPFAAIFGMNWFFYRKMYGLGLLLHIADWLALFYFGKWEILLLVRVPVGVYANIAYFNKAEKTVTVAQAAQLPKDDTMRQLKQDGGVNFPAFLAGVVLNVAITLILSSVNW